MIKGELLGWRLAIDWLNSDRQENIIALKKELRESNELLEAAKTAHNVLVSELEKSKGDLAAMRGDLVDADGKFSVNYWFKTIIKPKLTHWKKHVWPHQPVKL